MNIRYVEVKGNVYLRAEDVYTFLTTLAYSEDIDTRKRIEEAAMNLLNKKPILEYLDYKDYNNS
jgi:hypothetical protein